MDNTIVISIISMVGLGTFFAVVLAMAHKKFHVEEDPSVLAVEEALLGLNCGACGFASCHVFAVSAVKGQAPVNSCLPGGEEVASKIADVLGVEKKAAEKRVAVVHCGAKDEVRAKKAKYRGVNTCAGANLVFGGEIACLYGCLGYGDCKEACPFGAIQMVDGLPRVDGDKCTGCGLCVAACPRGIISLEKFDEGMLIVACNSQDPGRLVRKVCPVGCIACGICEKLSGGVFSVKDNLAGIDYKRKDEVVNGNELIEKCPTGTIIRME